MSKDKHKGVERRKFVLANLPGIDGGRRKVFRGFAGESNPRNGERRRDYVDVTADLKRLEKEGKVVRVRSQSVGSAFGRHIRRTRLVARNQSP